MMEADSPAARRSSGSSHADESCNRRLSTSYEEIDADSTLHGFNVSNLYVTVVETNSVICECSDSGVEVIDANEHVFQRALSSNSGNSHDFCAPSCDSSIISCCSNYEDAYNLLARRNSTLLEDYPLRPGDRTSDNGSESSSITGSATSRTTKRGSLLNAKKKVALPDAKKTPCKERSRSKPPQTTRRVEVTQRLKSLDREKTPKKQTPQNLELKRTFSVRGPKTPTPTDDGRWPSVNSRPAPLMSRSLRAAMGVEAPRSRTAEKTIEKYATLPRRRRDKPAEETVKPSPAKKPLSREATPLVPPRRKQKVKIYHETGSQTALTITDVNRALAGVPVTPSNPTDKETCDKNEQVDLTRPKVELLEAQIRNLTEKFDALTWEFKAQGAKLEETSDKLRDETVQKESLQEELKTNSQRVLAILGEANVTDGENASSDSLMVLESRFQNVSQVVIHQEEEISKLNACCRTLHMDLERSTGNEKILAQQQQELEAESRELQEFLQAEKNTLCEALKETEDEVCKWKKANAEKNKEVEDKEMECRKLRKQYEQQWKENLRLQARMGALEAKSRELLVYQGSSVSGTSVALSALIGRLENLVEEIVTSYSISDQELEDVIFHNEAYSNCSSPEMTPEKTRKFLDKTPSPKKGSTFVAAVINAIRNAASQGSFSTKELDLETSSSNEMLESETEPCLMMEPVLEDVLVPDGHTFNMISSCHKVVQGDSSYIEKASQSLPSFSLVDQVIDVDNLVTKLLKVIRILQLESDDCMTEMQEQRDGLAEQLEQQSNNHNVIAKQLRDWDVFGARLKTEVKELMQQLSRKNQEIDNIKGDLNKQREEVEKLNQDVCELSTALAKAELELKLRDEQVQKAVKNWGDEVPSLEVLAGLQAAQNDIPALQEKLAQKERHFYELTQEFVTSRQVLTESLKAAVTEAKRQYDAIDKALEVLHSNQNVVQQCVQLADLQRELESTNFQSASAMPFAPPDCNANAALLQAIAKLQINTTA